MRVRKKITVEVPADLLRRAQESTGVGLAETILKALELLAAGGAYEKLRRLRGTVPFALSLRELRKDRS